MSNLILVRHGQATFLQGDYDRLSPLGVEQARHLGRFWAEKGIAFDRVFTGPRVRQARTAEIVGNQYQEQGLALPPIEKLEELNEYDADVIMREFLPILSEKSSRVRILAEQHELASGTDRYQTFQKVFEVVMVAWIEGKVSKDGVESWAEYRARVKSGIEKITRTEGKGLRIAAFTSGGPIAATMQLALGISDRSTLELNWRVRNCSLSEFIFSGERFSLDSFNALPHLREESLWSYR